MEEQFILLKFKGSVYTIDKHVIINQIYIIRLSIG